MTIGRPDVGPGPGPDRSGQLRRRPRRHAEPSLDALQAGDQGFETGGDARHAREPLRHQAPGPDLDERQPLALIGKLSRDDALQALPVRSEHRVAEPRADLGLDGRDEGARGALVRPLRGDPDVNLSGMRHRADRRVRALGHEIREKLSHAALPDPGHAHEPRHDGGLEPIAGADVGERPREQQVLHLAWHAGQDDQGAVALLDDEAGRGPDRVRNGERASRDIGLLPVRRRERASPGPERRPRCRREARGGKPAPALSRGRRPPGSRRPRSGPRPPVVITTSARPSAVSRAAATRARLSPTVVLWKRSRPRTANCLAMKAAFVSTICPRRSSEPTLTISARMGQGGMLAHGLDGGLGAGRPGRMFAPMTLLDAPGASDEGGEVPGSGGRFPECTVIL